MLIIGAGIIGIACAHYLSEAGYKVTVIDKETIAGACSSGNCGHILPSHILPLNSPGAVKTAIGSIFDPASPFRMKLRPDPAFLRWMIEFARHSSARRIDHAATSLKVLLDSSFREFERLVEGPEFDCDWTRRGLLYLFKNEKSLDAFSKTNDQIADQFGVEAELIDAERLNKMDPSLRTDLAGGFFYAGDASLSPERLGRVWSQSLMANGVDFIEHCAFESLEKDKNRVAVLHTSKGVFNPDLVVLAAGAVSCSLARQFGRSLPIEPGKGYAITVPRPEPCPQTPIVLPEASIAITPFKDGLRIGSMMEFVGFDQTMPARRAAQLRDGAAAFLQAPLPAAPEHRWFGWRPMTWDSLPVIGRFPGLDNAYLATGHQMIGMMTAPGTGKLLAEIIAGRPAHIPDAPYSPARFYS